MLENCTELTLALLNEATLAWLELEYNREIHAEIGVPPLRRFLDGPDVGRPSPTSDELRLAFTAAQYRTQRHSDGTISLEGRRFEVPSRYRHLDRVAVRWARWDLSHIWMVDDRTAKVLCRLFPLDRTRNADGVRRTLDPVADGAVADWPPPQPGIAPLLKQLMDDFRATGLPPAYVPMAPRAARNPTEGDAP